MVAMITRKPRRPPRPYLQQSGTRGRSMYPRLATPAGHATRAVMVKSPVRDATRRDGTAPTRALPTRRPSCSSSSKITQLEQTICVYGICVCVVL